eukprot:TRINITY_DN10902_c0_g2_i1.p1 TRINITY_DN10902_c0_g2~~TRINITY_DN10902_c0_g2_i1.p1  ORF type:complete len:107 (-),score=7.68 TRINITY_DN10902_c0_g2_i1:30-350(-)
MLSRGSLWWGIVFLLECCVFLLYLQLHSTVLCYQLPLCAFTQKTYEREAGDHFLYPRLMEGKCSFTQTCDTLVYILYPKKEREGGEVIIACHDPGPGYCRDQHLGA